MFSSESAPHSSDYPDNYNQSMLEDKPVAKPKPPKPTTTSSAGPLTSAQKSGITRSANNTLKKFHAYISNNK